MLNLKFGVHVIYYVDVFQGMSDFLAPILYVMEDESESFWCFASLMERLGANFNRDQNGMHAQLLALSKVYNIFICQVLSEAASCCSFSIL
jgi:translation elongation factor EF-G